MLLQEADDGPDLRGAYMPGPPGARPRSPVHEHWCLLLAAAAAVLRGGATAIDMRGLAVDLLRAAEARLVAALALPHGDAAQPLTRGALLEAERALFLLKHLIRCLPSSQLRLCSVLRLYRGPACWSC